MFLDAEYIVFNFASFGKSWYIVNKSRFSKLMKQALAS